MSVEEFLANGVPKLDDQLAERVDKAAARGNVLRYVCVIEGSRYCCTFIFIPGLVFESPMLETDASKPGINTQN